MIGWEGALKSFSMPKKPKAVGGEAICRVCRHGDYEEHWKSLTPR
jgi:hypothetical protein